ncbi:DUF3375 domain-containing protein [Promicromonospora sukumoe]|uniref:DUF3375 family protein n=1 Tax=Promicromonospora sukumoe TaxID=88382 RepID=A0A7W3J5S1_9MICO|nr:DUF3375 domain-containing protein [Promicromonospora sukumoe]MBA8806767.1 hypothetical protein [Promicromonospora sukumoe]
MGTASSPGDAAPRPAAGHGTGRRGQAARAVRALLQEHPAWVLLRSRNAAAAVVLLDRNLGASRRRLPVEQLADRIDDDVPELRRAGFELPYSGYFYVSEWIDEGVLVRRRAPQTGGEPGAETVELSDGALLAIRFVSRLRRPHPAVTPSRLGAVLDGLHRLADEADPDPEARLAALLEQRAALDAKIERARRGDSEALPADVAAERAREILALAGDIPADLARVRTELERTDRELRRRLLESDGSRDTFLDDIYRGVDHLAESEAGRGLVAFRELLRQSEHSAQDDLGRVLDSVHLAPGEASALRRLLPTLHDAADELTDTMGVLRRALQRTVRSGALPAERALRRLIGEAQDAALAAAPDVGPGTELRLTLPLGAVAPRSVGGLAPHNPGGEDAEAPAAEPALPPRPVSLTALRAMARDSEIDVDELRGHVNDTVDRAGRATVGSVLDAHPATQGAASVVGLLTLAEQHGTPTGEREDVGWRSSRGVPRRAALPQHQFEEHVP